MRLFLIFNEIQKSLIIASNYSALHMIYIIKRLKQYKTQFIENKKIVDNAGYSVLFTQLVTSILKI